MRHQRVLFWIFILAVIYLVVEIVGGLVTHSLALLADGFHLFADAASIGISLFAAWLSHRPAPAQKTFGYQRVEILAAFFNALLLVIMGLGILIQSVDRLRHPVVVQANLMLWIALGGLVLNIVFARLLHGDQHSNMNIRGAYLHVLGDLLGTIGTIVAAILILTLNWQLSDPLIGCLIALLVGFSGINLLRDAVNVLLEGSPAHLDVEEVRHELLHFEGIHAVHNLHVWNIDMQRTVLTAHLEVTKDAFSGETLTRVQDILKERFGLAHVTLQMEQV